MDTTLAPMPGDDFATLDRLSAPNDAPLIDVNDLDSPAARHLFSWWKAHYDRDGNPPSRSQFDIGDFLPYASQMFLASKTSDGEWVYKVRGEAFKELFGPLKTEVDVGRYRYRVFDMPVSDYLNLVAENGMCRRTKAKFTSATNVIKRFESIDCPLLDDDGRPSHVIGIATVH